MAELQVSQSNQNNYKHGTYLRKIAKFNSESKTIFVFENILSIQTAAKYDK